MGVRAVALDYAIRGHRRGLSVNPLVDELVLGSELPEADRVPAMYAYLVSDRGRVRVHPWWDAPRYGESLEEVGRQTPLEHAWQHRDDVIVDLSIGDDHRSIPLVDLRRWAIEAGRSWRRRVPVRLAAPTPASPPAVSVVRFLQRADAGTDAKLVVVSSLADDVQSVIATVGIDASQWISLELMRRLRPDLTHVALAADVGFADAVAASAALAVGDAVVVLDPRSSPTADRIRELAGAAAPGRCAVPVSLAADGTIGSVGAVPIGGMRPARVLSAMPQEDLVRLGVEPILVPLLAGRTFAIHRGDLTSLGGLDPRSAGFELEELSHRWRTRDSEVELIALPALVFPGYAPELAFARRNGRAWTGGGDRSEWLRELLMGIGFQVDGWRVDPDGETRPVLRRPPSQPERWAIRTSSPAGPRGEVWGDTHFARGLASALRRAGREVVVDAFEARHRPTAELDDVTVVVRGPHRILPPANGVRIEWIISHPDQITAGEVRGFDLVFAASARWAAKATTMLGVPVEPLLEATDTDLFHPRGLPRGDDIVFVGTSRGIPRPSVVAPLAAGVRVRVYGPDWRGFIPSDAIAARSIPNADLSERYETAAVVLNDHWPAMRREGFMAMRPFDVVAAGGRVISEDVDGLEEVFGPTVRAYRDDSELVEMLTGDLDASFPPEEELAPVRERVRREHSFDARAATLIAAVTRRGARPSGPVSQDPSD